MNGRKDTDDGNRLGSKALQILAVIRGAEIPLTHEEIGQQVDLSKSGVHYHVEVLKDAGLVDNKFYSPRSTKG